MLVAGWLGRLYLICLACISAAILHQSAAAQNSDPPTVSVRRCELAPMLTSKDRHRVPDFKGCQFKQIVIYQQRLGLKFLPVLQEYVGAAPNVIVSQNPSAGAPWQSDITLVIASRPRESTRPYEEQNPAVPPPSPLRPCPDGSKGPVCPERCPDGVGIQPNCPKRCPDGVGFEPKCRVPCPDGVGFQPKCRVPCASGGGYVPNCQRPTPVCEDGSPGPVCPKRCPDGVGFEPKCRLPCPDGVGFQPNCRRPCPDGIGYVPNCQRPPPLCPDGSRGPDCPKPCPDGVGFKPNCRVPCPNGVGFVPNCPPPPPLCPDGSPGPLCLEPCPGGTGFQPDCQVKCEIGEGYEPNCPKRCPDGVGFEPSCRRQCPGGSGYQPNCPPPPPTCWDGSPGPNCPPPPCPDGFVQSLNCRLSQANIADIQPWIFLVLIGLAVSGGSVLAGRFWPHFPDWLWPRPPNWLWTIRTETSLDHGQPEIGESRDEWPGNPFTLQIITSKGKPRLEALRRTLPEEKDDG